MKAKGNGNAETCVQNLCSIVRGEVFGDRCRGIDGALIDGRNVSDELTEDIKWLVKEYEPRINVEDVSVEPDEAKEGVFNVSVNIERGE